MKSPLTLVAWKTGADVAARGVMFAITVLAAHRLTRAAFGAFALATTLGWMLAVASDGGIQLHVARVVAQWPRHAAAIVERWLRVRIAAFLFVTGGMSLAAAAGMLGPDWIAPLVIVIAYLIGGLGEFFYYFYRGLGRTDVESSLILTQRGLTLLAAIAVLVLMPRLDLLAFALLLPAMITLALSVAVARRLVRETGGHASGSAVALAPMGRELLRDVLPIGAGILLSALYFRIDVFLIQRWLGADPVALYAAVFRLVEALRLFPAAALAVALPGLCRARDAGPLLRISSWLTLGAFAGTLPLVALAAWIVTVIYGPAYADASAAFQVLLFAFPLLSLNYALTHQLIAWNAHLQYARICAAAVLVNLAANAVLIPSAGIVGAAWATLLTEIVLTAGCVLALARAVPGGRPALEHPVPPGVRLSESP